MPRGLGCDGGGRAFLVGGQEGIKDTRGGRGGEPEGLLGVDVRCASYPPPPADVVADTAAPLIVARFTQAQCQPCPAHSQCTTSREVADQDGAVQERRRELSPEKKGA